MSSVVAETLHDLASALEGLGAGWYLFGAQAALMRGGRRLTTDVDVTLLPGQASTAEIVSRMRAAGFTLQVPNADEFVALARVLPFLHDSTGMAVDLVFGGPGLEEVVMQASERVDVDGVIVPVPTVEHLILLKLLAGRPKDLEDATAMARANDVDFDAVDHLAHALADDLGEHDVLDALAQLRRSLIKR